MVRHRIIVVNNVASCWPIKFVQAQSHGITFSWACRINIMINIMSVLAKNVVKWWREKRWVTREQFSHEIMFQVDEYVHSSSTQGARWASGKSVGRPLYSTSTVQCFHGHEAIADSCTELMRSVSLKSFSGMRQITDTCHDCCHKKTLPFFCKRILTIGLS